MSRATGTGEKIIQCSGRFQRFTGTAGRVLTRHFGHVSAERLIPGVCCGQTMMIIDLAAAGGTGGGAGAGPGRPERGGMDRTQTTAKLFSAGLPSSGPPSCARLPPRYHSNRPGDARTAAGPGLIWQTLSAPAVNKACDIIAGWHLTDSAAAVADQLRPRRKRKHDFPAGIWASQIGQARSSAQMKRSRIFRDLI